MFLTPRDTLAVHAVALYQTVTREQVGTIAYPTDRDGRITRARLLKIKQAGLVNRTSTKVVTPTMGAAPPVYYPSHQGLAYLAQELDDERWLYGNTEPPHWMYLYHYVAVAQTHILVDQAVSRHKDVQLMSWISERDLADPSADTPSKKYYLYTLLQEKPRRIVCVPDAAFLLDMEGTRKVFYLEQDRDTTKNADRVAAKKSPGYAALAEVNGHARHFPTTNQEKFLVLVVAPTEKRRNALMRAFRNKPGANLYRFVSLTDTKAESFFTERNWYTCDGQARSLIVQETAS